MFAIIILLMLLRKKRLIIFFEIREKYAIFRIMELIQ